MKYKKAAIIGSGGIACQMVPLLSLDREIVLVDGDKFEPHNSTRQFPALSSEGNKAKVLAEMQNERCNHDITYIESYLEGIQILNKEEWAGVDLIIGAVDNNESRVLITEVAQEAGLPAILCGNETNVGEAHLFLPDIYNPMDHHDFGEMTPAPFSCTHDDNAESAPQTGTANFLAAASGLYILSAIEQVSDVQNYPVHVAMDIRSGTLRSRLRDYGVEVEE